MFNAHMFIYCLYGQIDVELGSDEKKNHLIKKGINYERCDEVAAQTDQRDTNPKRCERRNSRKLR